MSDEWFAFWSGVVAGIVAGMLLAAFAVNTETYKAAVVCKYIGGEVKEDICVRDGRIIELPKE